MAIQREIWARTIVEGLFADNSFASKSVDDSEHVNEGKRVHIPNAGAPPDVKKNRSTVPASASKRTDVDVDYELDEFTTDPIVIPHAETVELSYNKRNSVVKQSKNKLIDDAAQSLLYSWEPGMEQCISTSGAAEPAYTDKATGNRKAVTKKDIRKLMTKFDRDNVPEAGRYLLLDATMYAHLLDSMTETESIGFFNAADVKKGVIGELYGFKVMKRSQVLRYKSDGTLSEFDKEGTATDNAAALAWHEDSVSRALGEVEVFDKTRDPLYYGDLYSFLVRCGGAKRRSDKKGVYLLVQSAVA